LFKTTTRNHHQQLDPGVKTRNECRIEQLKPVIEETNPIACDELANLVTMSVMPEDVTLSQDDIGEKAYVTFIHDRVIGDGHMWNKMTKVNLKF
jgi:hypothetical protein